MSRYDVHPMEKAFHDWDREQKERAGNAPYMKPLDYQNTKPPKCSDCGESLVLEEAAENHSRFVCPCGKTVIGVDVATTPSITTAPSGEKGEG